MGKKNRKITEELNWEDLLRMFLAEKKAQGRSETTVSDYNYHVKQFYRQYPNGDLKENLYAYMSQDMAPATYNIRLAYLKGYYKWTVDNGFLKENPLANLKQRKAEPRIVSIDQAALSALLALPDISTYAGLRDKALICLTLDTGIRPKEARLLMVSDFSAKNLEVVVRAGVAKTRSLRVLPISPLTASMIGRLVCVRPKEWNDSVPLFASADGTVLNRSTWLGRLEAYSLKIGVKIRPCGLRHAFALGFLRNGGNALFLQKLMGHADLTMTKRYVAATDEDLRNAHQIASPLINLVKPKRLKKIDSAR